MPSIPLKTGIPIAEHLANLTALPVGLRFTTVLPTIEGAGTFTMRTFADVTDSETPASG